MTRAEFLADVEKILADGDPEWAAAVRRGMAAGEVERNAPVPGSDDLLEPWPTVTLPNPPRADTGD